MKRFLISATAFTALAVAAPGAATAIICDGNFQLLPNGGEIATPYCEDGELARVAYRNGMCVTAREIRNHPSAKEEACKLVGDDIRVRDTCIPYRNWTGPRSAAP